MTEQELKQSYAAAAERWNAFIKIKNTNHAAMRAERTGWNGLEVKEVEWVEDADLPWIMAAGYYEILKDTPDWCNFTYKLYINTHWFRKDVEDAFFGSNWLSKHDLSERMHGTFLHEIGHALGITNATDSYYKRVLNPSLVEVIATDNQFFTSASNTPNAIAAFGQSIPLQSTNDNDKVAHMSSVARVNSSTGVSHPGSANDPLGVPYTSESRKITPLTIGYLKDIGYEEVNPGAAEAAIDFNNSVNPTFIQEAKERMPNLPDNFSECGTVSPE